MERSTRLPGVTGLTFGKADWPEDAWRQIAMVIGVEPHSIPLQRHRQKSDDPPAK